MSTPSAPAPAPAHVSAHASAYAAVSSAAPPPLTLHLLDALPPPWPLTAADGAQWGEGGGGLEGADAVVCAPARVSAARAAAPRALVVALQPSDAAPGALADWGEAGGAAADEVAWAAPAARERDALLRRLRARRELQARREEAERKSFALELASECLSKVHDENEIFQRLVDIVAEQLSSERVSLLRVDHARGELRMRAAYGIPAEVVAQARPRIGEGIAGRCAALGRPIFISDHERFRAQGADERPGGHPRPMSMTVPILMRGEVVGVVNVTGRAQATPYSQHDIAFLSALMSHAGYLMESATLVANQQALKAFSDRVLNTLQDPLVVLDERGALLKRNERFSRIYSPLGDEVLHTPPPGVILGQSSSGEGDGKLLRWLERLNPQVAAGLAGALRAGAAWRHNGWRLGEEVFDLRLIPFAESSEAGEERRALLFFQDVTLRQQMQKQLVGAEKMASLGILSAGVAHEINNPLGFVKTNTKEAGRYISDLLAVVDAWGAFAEAQGLPASIPPRRVEEGVELDEVRRDAPALVRESLDGLDRMQKIIASLKSFAHPDTESTHEAQLSTLVEHALVITQGKWRHHLAVTKDLPAHPPLSCIPNQLEQVFMNLVVNAAQAAQGHGVTAALHISLSRPSEELLELCFADTCGGIPLKIVERIFDPFFTTKDIGEGTGLGLHIAHNIIEGHGGRIRVESDPPRGTTFVLTLPLGRQGGPIVVEQLSRFKV